MFNHDAFLNDLALVLKKHNVENFVYALFKEANLPSVSELSNDDLENIISRRKEGLADGPMFCHASILGDAKKLMKVFSDFLEKNPALICYLNDCNECEDHPEQEMVDESVGESAQCDCDDPHMECSCCGEKVDTKTGFHIIRFGSPDTPNRNQRSYPPFDKDVMVSVARRFGKSFTMMRLMKELEKISTKKGIEFKIPKTH